MLIRNSSWFMAHLRMTRHCPASYPPPGPNRHEAFTVQVNDFGLGARAMGAGPANLEHLDQGLAVDRL